MCQNSEYEKVLNIAGLSIWPLNKFFLPVCQDVQCDVNLVGHMSDTKFLK